MKLILQSVASISVIIISTVWMCAMYLKPPQIDRQPHVVLGHGAAEETARLIGYRGKIAVVAWSSDVRKHRMAGQEIELNQFKKIVSRLGVIEVLGVERVDVSEIDPQTMRLTGVFNRIVKKYPEADAVVSFIGLPDMEQTEISQLGRPLPKFVVVTDLTFGLDNFFKTKLVTVAIVPRPSGHEGDHDPQTPRDWFDYTYQVVTADTLKAPPKYPTTSR